MRRCEIRDVISEIYRSKDNYEEFSLEYFHIDITSFMYIFMNELIFIVRPLS